MATDAVKRLRALIEQRADGCETLFTRGVVCEIVRAAAAVCDEIAQDKQWLTLGRKPEFVDGWCGLPSDRGFISCKNAERAILSALEPEPQKGGDDASS